jgi:hypothetical protein
MPRCDGQYSWEACASCEVRFVQCPFAIVGLVHPRPETTPAGGCGRREQVHTRSDGEQRRREAFMNQGLPMIGETRAGGSAFARKG